MNQWVQDYDPLQNIFVSAGAAFVPILFFLLALTVFRMKGYIAGLITVLLTFEVAVVVYRMPPGMAFASALYGVGYGIWPVASIIVAAIFLYKIAVETGKFDVIRASISSVSEDQRVQLLLVGFSFGAFLEGAAGFGAPVAISSALLAGLGFKPLHAAGLCLIANTAPGAFGAMGIPVLIAGKVTGINPIEIGQMSVRQLPLLSLLVPFLLVFIMDGIRGWKETWPAILVSGGSFALTQYVIVHFVGPELADVTSASASLLALTLFVRVWKPARIFKYGERRENRTSNSSGAAKVESYSMFEQVKAWSPFIILTVFVSIWSIQPFKQLFAAGGPLAGWVWNIPIPYLHNLVIKSQPIVNKPTPYEAILKLDLISATGTAIFIAAVISSMLLRFPLSSAVKLLGETVKSLIAPILTICSVLAFAFVANYSGVSSTLGLALSASGKFFPLFSPFLGWLGVFLTGSVMSSNALFGNLQNITAQQIGVNPTLLVSTNVVGGVTAKMISPQSIAVASASVNLAGRESELFRFTVKYSLLFAFLVSVLTYLQAYWFRL